MAESTEQKMDNAAEGFDCRDGICVLPSTAAVAKDGDAAVSSENCIIPFRAQWKYWDKQFAPPENWWEVDFDDRQWPSAPAPLGYSFREEGTHIATGDQVMVRQPAYFRHEFWLEEMPGKDKVTLAVHRHGGVVVHINGEERFRDNASLVPEKPRRGWAISKTEDHPLQFPLWSVYLQKGRNVIAVEARSHFRSLCFDLALGADDSTIPRQPVFPPAPAPPLGISEQAPDLEWLEVGTRQRMSLKKFRGKKVILDILGIHCTGCWEEFPKLEHWAAKLKDKNVVVAVVSCLGTVADIEHLLQRHRDVFPTVLFGAEPAAGDLFNTMANKQFRIFGTPAMLLIDESGIIRATALGAGGGEYDQFIAKAAALGLEIPEFKRDGTEFEVVIDDYGELYLK